MHPSSLRAVVSRRYPSAVSILPAPSARSPVVVVPAQPSNSSSASVLFWRGLASAAGPSSRSGEDRAGIQRQPLLRPRLLIPSPRASSSSTNQHRCWFSSQSSPLPMVTTDDDDDRSGDEEDTMAPTTLDPLTMDRIVNDLQRTTPAAAATSSTSSSNKEDHPHRTRTGEVVSYEQIQRLFLLYPEAFDPHEAEALGELLYVGRGGQSICPRTFLRAVQYAVANAPPTTTFSSSSSSRTEHSHNNNNHNDDNDNDYSVQEYLQSFAPRQHPLPLAGIPPDACWGAGRWAREGTSPFVNPQEAFDRGLRRYAQAAHNRAHQRCSNQPCSPTPTAEGRQR